MDIKMRTGMLVDGKIVERNHKTAMIEDRLQIRQPLQNPVKHLYLSRFRVKPYLQSTFSHCLKKGEQFILFRVVIHTCFLIDEPHSDSLDAILFNASVQIFSWIRCICVINADCSKFPRICFLQF